MNILEKITLECEAKGTSLYEVEKRAGLSRGSIYKWDTHIPRADKVKKVANVLKVSVDRLLE